MSVEEVYCICKCSATGSRDGNWPQYKQWIIFFKLQVVDALLRVWYPSMNSILAAPWTTGRELYQTTPSPRVHVQPGFWHLRYHPANACAMVWISCTKIWFHLQSCHTDVHKHAHHRRCRRKGWHQHGASCRIWSRRRATRTGRRIIRRSGCRSWSWSSCKHRGQQHKH